jgi:hypothetical protein
MSNFELEDEDVVVLRSLYQRRLASTQTMIPVEPSERETILRGGEVSDLSAAREALSSVGIDLGIGE